MIKRITAACWLLAIAFTAGVVVLAHEMTYKGTVMAATASTVQVKLIDDTSKKETSATFTVTAKTKVFRGDKAISFADAKVQKDERIVVTVDHDQDGHAATMIRLAVQK